MKKLEINQVVTLIANVGVIASVAFLAYELNQNNKLLRAEADYNYFQARAGNRRTIATDPEYAEFWRKLEENGELTATEKVRLKAHIEGTILGWQYEYFQIIEGNFIDELDEAEARWRYATASGDAFANEFPKIWPIFRSTLREEFVSFIENSVLSE